MTPDMTPDPDCYCRACVAERLALDKAQAAANLAIAIIRAGVEQKVSALLKYALLRAEAGSYEYETLASAMDILAKGARMIADDKRAKKK